MSTTVGTRVPDELAHDIDYLASEEQQDTSKVLRTIVTKGVRDKLVELALAKYARHEVSMGRGAELARIPLAEFLRKAAEQKIPLNYTLQDLEEDLA